MHMRTADHMTIYKNIYRKQRMEFTKVPSRSHLNSAYLRGWGPVECLRWKSHVYMCLKLTNDSTVGFLRSRVVLLDFVDSLDSLTVLNFKRRSLCGIRKFCPIKRFSPHRQKKKKTQSLVINLLRSTHLIGLCATWNEKNAPTIQRCLEDMPRVFVQSHQRKHTPNPTSVT